MGKIIDADLAQAAKGIRGRAEAIQNTVFADAVPFDAEKFCEDVIIGS